MLFRSVEACLFGFEMLVLLAAQYLSAVDLIDRRDLVDAVAIQKNGVMRALVLMLLSGVFVPRAPAATARRTSRHTASLSRKATCSAQGRPTSSATGALLERWGAARPSPALQNDQPSDRPYANRAIVTKSEAP